MKKFLSPLFLYSLFVFIFFFFMLELLVEREHISASTYLSSAEILGYQPPDDPFYFAIYQHSTPIGFSQGFIGEIDENGETHYLLTEKTRLMLALADDFLETDMYLKTEVDEKFALKSFKADILTENNRIIIEGVVENNNLNLNIKHKEGEENKSFPLKANATLPVTLSPFLASKKLKLGETYAVDILDPLTLNKNTAQIRYIGKEEKLSKFEINLKGIVSYIYLDEKGEKVMEQLGSGIVSKKETRESILRIEKYLDSIKELRVD